MFSSGAGSGRCGCLPGCGSFSGIWCGVCPLPFWEAHAGSARGDFRALCGREEFLGRREEVGDPGQPPDGFIRVLYILFHFPCALDHIFSGFVAAGAFYQARVEQGFQDEVRAGFGYFQCGHYFLDAAGGFFQEAEKALLVLGQGDGFVAGEGADGVYAPPGAVKGF